MLSEDLRMYQNRIDGVACLFDGTTHRFVELMHALLPDCRICEDDDGQIVIYTGACMQMGGEIDVWEPEDEDAYRAWESRHPEIA